jgi:hypothetical protein
MSAKRMARLESEVMRRVAAETQLAQIKATAAPVPASAAPPPPPPPAAPPPRDHVAEALETAKQQGPAVAAYDLLAVIHAGSRAQG